MSYLYGDLFDSNNRVDKLNTLGVDYDRGVVVDLCPKPTQHFTANNFQSLLLSLNPLHYSSAAHFDN